MSLQTLKVNPKYRGSFWQEVSMLVSIPKELKDIQANGSIELTPERAQEVVSDAKRIPGWFGELETTDGRHPLILLDGDYEFGFGNLEEWKPSTEKEHLELKFLEQLWRK